MQKNDEITISEEKFVDVFGEHSVRMALACKEKFGDTAYEAIMVLTAKLASDIAHALFNKKEDKEDK